MRLEYTITDAEILDAFRRAPSVMSRHLGRGLDKAAMKMVQAARKELRNNDSLALSTLILSIAYRRTAVHEREVAPNADYALYVEKGTKGGYYPAPAPLQAWLRARGAAEPERAVFRLQKHIFRHGTKAHPFWQPAYEQAEPTMRQVIHDAVRRGVEKVLT